ncbi:hypothetical protein Tco_1028202, partial [Tanacetum coccineum]
LICDSTSTVDYYFDKRRENAIQIQSPNVVAVVDALHKISAWESPALAVFEEHHDTERWTC